MTQRSSSLICAVVFPGLILCSSHGCEFRHVQALSCQKAMFHPSLPKPVVCAIIWPLSQVVSLTLMGGGVYS